MRGHSNLPGQNNVNASQVMMENGTSVEDAVTKATENVNEDGAMSVAGGGTGVNTLTAGSYLVGNGTEDVLLKSPAEVLEDIGAISESEVLEITNEIHERIDGLDFYTKDETLLDDTKGLYGLPATSVPDDVFRTIENYLFASEPTYRWQKQKYKLVMASSHKMIAKINTGGGYSYGTALKYPVYYADDITINELTGQIDLVDPVELVNSYTYGTDARFSTEIDHMSTLAKHAYIQVGTAIYANPYYQHNSTNYYRQLGAYPVTANTIYELAESTDPNAYTEGYVDDENWTYTALEPVVSKVALMKTGSYAGTGTYGSSNPTVIALPFKAQVLLITSATTATVLLGTSTNVTVTDESVSITGSDAAGQYNTSNTIYNYVAFG